MTTHPSEGRLASADALTPQRPALIILVLLAAVSPLAINMFVPSMPSIGTDLGAPYAQVQWGLSLYLVFTAILQPISGPLSDRIGRRPVLLISLVLFLIGTAICMLAPTITVFLIGRVIQSASAAGMVLSRTIVRDIYPREKSASIIGYVVMGMAVAPMIGPAIGGAIDGALGWRASFAFLGLCGLVTLIATYFRLPETNQHMGATLAQQTAHWREALSMQAFWLYAGCASLTSCVFFGFLGGGPAVSSMTFGLTPFEYGLWFALCAGGYAFGNFLSGRFSETVGIEAMMRRGAFVTLGGVTITLVAFSLGFANAAALFIPLSLIGVGNGMTLPNVIAATISLKPEAAGAVSGLLGALQIGIGAAGSVFGGYEVGSDGSPINLAVMLFVFAVAAAIVTHFAAAQRPADVALAN
ncbi:MAG: multidrug effflux MFS transporter [Pseudomonadota bacterium]